MKHFKYRVVAGLDEHSSEYKTTPERRFDAILFNSPGLFV